MKHQIVRKDIDINEHEKRSDFTLRHNLQHLYFIYLINPIHCIIMLLFSDMALTVAGIQKFLGVAVSLQSFPLFCFYLILIMLSPVWQKVTSPIHFRRVSLIFYLLPVYILKFT